MLAQHMLGCVSLISDGMRQLASEIISSARWTAWLATQFFGSEPVDCFAARHIQL
jgi:hypothetical protein